MPAVAAAPTPIITPQTRTYAVFIELVDGVEVPPGLLKLTRKVQRVNDDRGLIEQLRKLVENPFFRPSHRTFRALIISPNEPVVESIEGVAREIIRTSWSV